MARKVNDQEDEKKIAESRLFFDEDETKTLQEAYDEALKEHKTHFKFKGEDMNTVYAKYILSYLKQSRL